MSFQNPHLVELRWADRQKKLPNQRSWPIPGTMALDTGSDDLQVPQNVLSLPCAGPWLGVSGADKNGGHKVRTKPRVIVRHEEEFRVIVWPNATGPCSLRGNHEALSFPRGTTF